LNSISFTLPAIQQDIEAVERLMLSQAVNYNNDLSTAISLLLSSGGKRIRPKIILLLGSIFKADKDLLLTLASSIELLHTATLVHDDLIDGSLLRRGVPTLNSKWSAAATVLTGDFIFADAAYLAAKTNSIEVMSVFSRTLMTIVNGEINQLFEAKCNPNKEDYYQRIYAKTASLFECCTHTTAIISGLEQSRKEKLRRFGYELGMAFQIVDDVLDYIGSPSEVGKPVGGDLRSGLLTLPAFYYMQSNPSEKNVKELLQENCYSNETMIEELIESISKSSAIDQSLAEADEFAHRALDLISDLPECLEKQELIQLTGFSVIRRT